MSSYSNNQGGTLLEEDVNDKTFLRNSRSQQNANSILDYEERRNQLLQKQKEIEQRTVESSERSLTYLRSSEEIGAATAEELLRQREQLQRSERQLDEINSTLRISQKHIQGIKSVFGGLKNFISGTKSLPVPSKVPDDPPVGNNSKLGDYVGRQSKPEFDSVMSHPAMKARANEGERVKSSTSSCSEVIDNNLDQMLNHMVRLKGLAHDLSEEIDSQNDLIDNIHDKTERAERTISKQNKDIRKLTK